MLSIAHSGYVESDRGVAPKLFIHAVGEQYAALCVVMTRRQAALADGLQVALLGLRLKFG